MIDNKFFELEEVKLFEESYKWFVYLLKTNILKIINSDTVGGLYVNLLNNEYNKKCKYLEREEINSINVLMLGLESSIFNLECDCMNIKLKNSSDTVSFQLFSTNIITKAKDAVKRLENIKNSVIQRNNNKSKVRLNCNEKEELKKIFYSFE